MPNNPLTSAELQSYINPTGVPQMPAGYFLASPVSGTGPFAYRLFDASYISIGIVDPNRLGTGSTGLGTRYLADDGTWKLVSSISGSTPTLAQVTTAGNTTTNAINVGDVTSTGVVKSVVNSVTAQFTAYNPATNYPRAQFQVGQSSSDVNIGLTIAPLFSSAGVQKTAFVQVSTNKNVTDSGMFGGYFSINTSTFTIGTNKQDAQVAGGVPIIFLPAMTEAMRIQTNGNVAIGTTTDAGYKLDVNGTFRTTSTITATLGNTNSSYLVNYDTSTKLLTYGDHFNDFGLGVTYSDLVAGDDLNNGSDIRFFKTHTASLNTPSTITSFGIGLQMQFQPGNAVQLMTSRSNTTPLYKRAQSNSTWGSWVRIWDENAFSSATIATWTDAYNRWAGVGQTDFNNVTSNQFFTGHTTTVNYPPSSDQSFLSGVSTMYNSTSGWMIATSRSGSRPLSYRKVSNGTWSTWYDIIAANNNGNVGIGTGTAIPAYRVDVRGTTLATSTISTQGAFNINPLAAPPVISSYTLSAGTNLGVGTYYYFVVYVTPLGDTSAGANLTVTTTTGNTTVNLTGIPISTDPRVIGRKIYRTLLNQTSDAHRFLVTINDNTTTTYTDSATDASLTGVALQYYKVNTTARYFTVSGVQGMVIDQNLTALGRNAGAAIISSSGAAIRTVLIGASAGQSITTGQANVIVGVAGGGLTTGNNNTLIGDLAGWALTTGYENTFLGGDAVGRFVTTGYRNTFIGNQAGRNLNDGSSQFTVGFENIAIGNRARMFANNNNNSIVIGNFALGLGSNTTVIGNSSTIFTSIPAGNLAVGTTTDAGFRLDVNGTARVQGAITSTALTTDGPVVSTSGVLGSVAGYTGMVTIQQPSPLPPVTFDIQNGIIVSVT